MARISPITTDAAIPPARPSTVLFGDTSGINGRWPIREPTK